MAERLEKGARSGSAQGSFFAETGRPHRTRARAPLRESSLHATVAQLLDWLLMPPAVFTTFPAGWGKMTPAMAGMLHRCGLKRGMPDLLVFHAGRCLGIELKVPGRAQSVAQRDMTARLIGAGIEVFVARSPEEVLDVLCREGIPVKKISGGTL